jgi:hypothetical protein
MTKFWPDRRPAVDILPPTILAVVVIALVVLIAPTTLPLRLKIPVLTLPPAKRDVVLPLLDEWAATKDEVLARVG